MARIKPAFPAVTCTAQSDYLTGQYPDTHGIVGNGWYSREDCEVRFWKQSNRLVHSPKIWDAASARRSDIHLREPFLVVQHVLDRGLFRHAAADVSSRRPKDSRRLHFPRYAAGRASDRARNVPALRVLGSAGVDQFHPLDRGGREAGRAEAGPHADARLPPTPGLQPAEIRTRRRERGGRSECDRRRGWRVDPILRRPRRTDRRALGVRHRPGLDAGPHQPRAATARE